MLIDKEMFDVVETMLIQQGKIAAFEAENGKVLGRMMITRAAVPEGIEIRTASGKTPQAFEASFDFYDSTVGLALFTDTKEAASGIWVTPQKDGADPPANDWIEFFVEKLMESIEEDGSYGIPIYSFVNDTCDMTIIPTKPDAE